MTAKSILFLLFITSVFSAFGKGRSGTYLITGKAINSHGDLITNTTIQLSYKKETIDVKVDDKGYYKIEIFWSIPCRSGISKRKQKRLMENYNPKWIEIVYNNSKIKIENQWRKYSNSFPENIDSNTRKLDLKFL